MTRRKCGEVTEIIMQWMRDTIDPSLIWQSYEGRTIFQDYDDDGNPLRDVYVIVWSKDGGSLLKKYIPGEILASL